MRRKVEKTVRTSNLYREWSKSGENFPEYQSELQTVFSSFFLYIFSLDPFG